MPINKCVFIKYIKTIKWYTASLFTLNIQSETVNVKENRSFPLEYCKII